MEFRRDFDVFVFKTSKTLPGAWFTNEKQNTIPLYHIITRYLSYARFLFILRTTTGFLCLSAGLDSLALSVGLLRTIFFLGKKSISNPSRTTQREPPSSIDRDTIHLKNTMMFCLVEDLLYSSHIVQNSYGTKSISIQNYFLLSAQNFTPVSTTPILLSLLLLLPS